MMDKTGGDAFPTTEHQHTETGHYPVTRNGMTLLDHFAGLAMQGGVAAGRTGDPSDFARVSYAIAAAMIAERNRIMTEKT